MNERYICRSCYAVWRSLESEDCQTSCPDCGAATWRIVSEDPTKFFEEFKGQPARLVTLYVERELARLELTQRRQQA